MESLQNPTTWVAISFIFFAALIWWKGRGPILAALDARIALIRAEIDAAQNLRKEGQALFDDYEAKHLEIVRQSEHVIKVATKQADEMRRQAEADIAETIAQREKQLEDRIQRMKQSAMEDIQRYAADLAIRATAGIITEKLDADTREKLADQSIANLGKNLN